MYITWSIVTCIHLLKLALYCAIMQRCFNGSIYQGSVRYSYSIYVCRLPVAMVAAESGGVAVRNMGYWGSPVSPRIEMTPAESVGGGSCFTLASRCCELGSVYCATSLWRYLCAKSSTSTENVYFPHTRMESESISMTLGGKWEYGTWRKGKTLDNHHCEHLKSPAE